MAKFAPGHKKLGGRKPGTPNQFTTLKADWLAVHERLGGINGLYRYAKAHPGWFYTNETRLFPQELQHSGEVKMDGELTIKVVETKETPNA